MIHKHIGNDAENSNENLAQVKNILAQYGVVDVAPVNLLCNEEETRLPEYRSRHMRYAS